MTKIQSILSYFNFGLLVFMCVIMVFHSGISLPQWLTHAGRLHPLLIHLPIGMFIFIVIMMSIKNKFESKAIQPIMHFMVGVSTLFSMLSIIAGLFLSLENSYTKEDFLWHRNTAFAFGLSQYLLYILFAKGKPIYEYILSVISVILLIISSHLGANITHGKSFLFPEKNIAETEVNAQNNSVFELAIQPIIKEKCASCHNDQKSKGDLILTDTLAIKKGGEHGSIIVSGNAAQSKMIQYLFLPLTDKHHMPPDGKPALTNEEKNSLKWWVDSGASFTKKINQYNDNDSIKIYVTQKLTRQKQTKTYHFNAVNAATLSALQSSYVSVKPISSGSPALEASFFVSAAFNNDRLKALQKIKTQLIALNLSSMPLDDQSISHILSLTSLEKLILNGCMLTDAQFQKLASLPHLEILSASNNDLSVMIEKSFKKFPVLKKLYLNNTKIDFKTIQTYTNKYPSIQFMSMSPITEMMALTSPILKNEKNVLKAGETIVLQQFIKDAFIRYTMDGTEPDSVRSPIYKTPIPLKSSATIKAISVKEGWIKSPITTIDLFTEGLNVKECQLLTKANVQYLGLGSKTLINQEKAPITNLKDPNWIAFREVPFSATFTMKEELALDKISFCYGVQIPAYVFPPVTVRVYGSNTFDTYTLIKEIKTSTILPKDKDLVNTDKLDIALNGSRYKYYKIEAYNLSKIPQWHAGKGERGWLFIDEIFFYAQ